MSNIAFPRIRMIVPIVVALMLAAGCSGGGGGDLFAGIGSGGTGNISGFAIMGPMSNATVTAYGISNGQMGAQIATATTAADGAFTMSIGSYAGPVMLQVSGGSYTDEATGIVMPMAPGDVITAVLPTVAAGANTSGIQVTPVTAMAQAMAQNMPAGLTDANIAAANTAMGNYFSVNDILHVQPMNPLVAGSGTGASQDAQNYGMTLAAMSQYARTLGLSTSSSVVTAMMNDAVDGILDSKAGALPVQMGGMMGGVLPAMAGTTGMGTAMTAFMNSTQNKSGVTTATLANKLTGGSGQIPSGVPAMMNATLSGTVFNGPVSKATVSAFSVNGGVMGAQIASAATDSQGNFTLPLGSYSGPVMLQTSGASYTDEATKTTVTMAANEFMTAVLPTIASGANVTGVWVTPVTAMAQARASAMSGGLTDANIAAANTAMGNYFLVSDILHVRPMNPLVAGSATGASQDAKNYGMTLAAMSQYARTLGLGTSSTMVTAMMNDAADGILNGKNGTGLISMPMGGMMGANPLSSAAGTTGLATAMTAFMNSNGNASGLTLADMAALMNRLNSSAGGI